MGILVESAVSSSCLVAHFHWHNNFVAIVVLLLLLLSVVVQLIKRPTGGPPSGSPLPPHQPPLCKLCKMVAFRRQFRIEVRVLVDWKRAYVKWTTYAYSIHSNTPATLYTRPLSCPWITTPFSAFIFIIHTRRYFVSAIFIKNRLITNVAIASLSSLLSLSHSPRLSSLLKTSNTQGTFNVDIYRTILLVLCGDKKRELIVNSVRT